ncbi:uncharacterized protein PHALS_08421 [Plasmopara halstedii]|uniref:Uncharacterized protein n=1 Tax=Plasmopara halstedii TaxID=4781 RepID=A0A0P1ACW2_PLAHL|nr:uncharacterized protein PHALS_08421 [Plasmopara halstedii]CEG38340.1 hypothetical protein PHALS_08421 [Plasmopara halstedii]|eukprot:XP_024574709.1 hypothetical protein PHALS_08421 [Plasmopara halstedii]
MTDSTVEEDAANISQQLAAEILEEDDTRVITKAVRESHDLCSIPPTPACSLEPHSPLQNPVHRRPLFSSMREALESSGQVKEEPGGYIIKRRNGRQKTPFRFGESGRKLKSSANRQNEQQPKCQSNNVPQNSAVDDADAAGYTIIRRRSSCDENFLYNSASAVNFQSTSRQGIQAIKSAGGNKKLSQRPRRGSMSALSQSSSLLASISPAPSTSVPPGFQPRSAASQVVIQPPSGLTPAASGWVTKAAASGEPTKKIQEPPVEALWPEVKSTAAVDKTDTGWDVAKPVSDSHLQQWAVSTSTSSSPLQVDVSDDDDLLVRLGVTF